LQETACIAALKNQKIDLKIHAYIYCRRADQQIRFVGDFSPRAGGQTCVGFNAQAMLIENWLKFLVNP
jgi:hypothetical protein